MKIKKLILSIVLISSAFSSFAQGVYLTDSMRWHICEGVWTSWSCSLSLQLYGDTTINGLDYEKIYASNDSLFNPNNASYVGAMRENGLQWVFIKASDSVEYMLYDFGVQPGDSIDIYNPWSFTQDTFDFVVDSITYQINNGYSHKVFHLRREIVMIDSIYIITHREQWIEGIGSIFGLIHHADMPIDFGFTLNCFSKKDSLLYKSGHPIFPCWTDEILSTEKIQTKPNVKFYPNPAINYLNIELEKTHELIEIEVYNLFGQLIEITHQTQLNVSNYPTIFLVKVKTESGTVIEKILKQ